MNVTVVPARLLAPEHITAWSALQDSDASLASPFLSPDFTLAVAAVRNQVYVGILEEGGVPVGFFPFQRGRFSVGEPVGAWLNEVQAVIARPGMEWDAVDLVRQCGLTAWHFSRMLGCQTAVEPFHYSRRTSGIIDLSLGYETYAAERRHAGSRMVEKVGALARKLARDVGPLRFEPHSPDAGLLRTLAAWKLERYAGDGYVDMFAVPWARRLFERIHGTTTPRFGGLLSALSAGQELVAVHIGMRSRTTWHYWQPAYNQRFARYSPGSVLLLKMAAHASHIGVRAIELSGADEYPYKQRVMNSTRVLLEGTVGRLPVITAAARLRHTGGKWVRKSAYLRPPARAVLRAYRRARHMTLR